MAEEETARCIACGVALRPRDLVYTDADGGTIHAACCGPERDSYVGPDGEPLKPGEPIPQPWAWFPYRGYSVRRPSP